MKKSTLSLLFISISALILSSCGRDSDGSSAMRDRIKSLWGDDPDALLASEGFYGPKDDDFIPLQEQDLKSQFADRAIPQPSSIPGEPGSGIPTLDKFREPLAQLASVFKTIYFNTDDHVVRKPEYFQVIDRVADYMKSHPKTVISVGGHCDERASEAYNLALGTRRSNFVRSLLVQKGIDPERIHTISYGKEHPSDYGHNASAWSKNRRVEFKLYEKN